VAAVVQPRYGPPSALRLEDVPIPAPGPGHKPSRAATDPAIHAALDAVGPRLRQARELRELTLTDVADRTDISKSTLSRLENGQRRPTLELLLTLAAVYRIPLDGLVGAPETGDRRLRPKPRRVNGRTVLPLTQPGGVQAWKIIVPSTQTAPAPRRHDGFEWLCVLSGRLRVVLGEEDLSLGVGEAVEFDTQVPHWFGSTGDGPVEVLSIFGRPGERVFLRGAYTPASTR
jgi:transcriptional regulator with XRE-family HTH domain